MTFKNLQDMDQDQKNTAVQSAMSQEGILEWVVVLYDSSHTIVYKQPFRQASKR